MRPRVASWCARLRPAAWHVATIGAAAIVGSATRQPFLMGAAGELHPDGAQHGHRLSGSRHGLVRGRGRSVRLMEAPRDSAPLRIGRCAAGKTGGDGLASWPESGPCWWLWSAFSGWRSSRWARASPWIPGSCKHPRENWDQFPWARWRVFTAIAFLGASLGLAILAWSRQPASREAWNIAGAGATVTGAIGLVFVLGYLFSPDDSTALRQRGDPDGAQYGHRVRAARDGTRRGRGA